MKGYIYGIFHNERCLYVGSTKDFICRRSNHICDSNLYKRPIYNYINGLESKWKEIKFTIFEEEEYPSKQERLKKEREYYDKYKEELLNENIPWKSEEDIKNLNKIRYKKNKNEILKRSKEYYEKNKDYIKERNLQKYYDNKEQCVERMKKYRNKNSDKMKEYQKNYRKANLEYFKEYQKNYREKKNQVKENKNNDERLLL